MADQARINGNLFSWSSIVFKIDGDRYFGIRSISYADKRERSFGYGMGRHHGPRGRSAGKYSAEPTKVVMHKDSVRDLRAALAEQSSDGVSFGNVVFQIAVSYVEGDETPVQDDLVDCVWTGTSVSAEEGPDPMYEEIEINTLYIKWNGLTQFDATEGSP
jgi:hypothetical protein